MSVTTLLDELLPLIQAVAGQDRQAFAELYRLTNAKLFGIARRLLRNDAEAAEAVQDIFVRVWQRAECYDPARGRVMGWMCGVLRNLCIDRLRGAARRDRDLAALPDADEGVDSGVADGLDLARCLGILAASERQIILLAMHHGLSHGELAQRFAVPLGTMKSTIRRGLAKLRFCLDDGAVAVMQA